MRGVYLNQKYCDGLAKRSALEKYESKISHIIEEEGIFERLGLWEKINEISQRKIFISHGSYLILEQTSSFFVIDVNSGKNLKVGTKELNLLAIYEVASVYFFMLSYNFLYKVLQKKKNIVFIYF